MSAAAYPRLLSPLRIGEITLRNRVVFGAHGTGFGTDGRVNARHIAYLVERARGGVGLVVTEATGVDASPTGVTTAGRNIRNIDDTIIPSYRKLADAVHAEGARVFALLSHSGRNVPMGADGMPPKAPSALPMDRTRDIPHELEIDEIAEIIRGFAAAARRCREGGLDGVELSFVHGNLVQQFLSPAANQRSDAYGGSEDRRLRLAREVLQACRAAVGPDYVLGIRFSAAELVPGGFTLEDGARFAPMFVDWGKLDFIDVSAGDNASMRSRSFHYPTIATPARPLVPMARAIRGVVDVPVSAVGKIGDADEAESIVANGDADLVVMVRAHIAEPEIVQKITTNRHDEIRACIYCNESCFGRQQRVGDISCVYNPRSGREVSWPAIRRTDSPKHVVVVGGGPAGLEAARTAAKRGHRVDLYERAQELGGQVRLLARTPYRDGYLKIIDWQKRALSRHGVNVLMGEAPTAAALQALRPDVIVIATGSVDEKPPLAGVDLPHVVTGRQVLAGTPVGRRVVVADWDGRHFGTSVAERLADAGHEVVLVSSAFFIGMDIDLLTWRPLYERLLDLKVELVPLEVLAEVTPSHAVVQRLNQKTRAIEADSVVVCTRGRAERTLYRALRGQIDSLHAIGDCWAPRQLEQAILEGAKVGRAI